ncbi:MAG: U32 family peptidase [Clostridiales bacterium]|nr:U32 family peptidase [Clostridiales bacterium]
MELLSPAGNRESLIAAAQNGADAVYLGAKALNARMGAGNFGRDELLWAADYLHERGLKLYVTVNVMVKQSEMGELESLAGTLAAAGVDAAIVSDLGAAAALAQMLPSLALHASTQMAIHNPQGMDVAARLSIARAVMARELSYAKIAQCAGRGVELEVFAHGALCTACSGQCLFSSLVGGRSGNRGACAQPCRLPYRLEGAMRAEGHLLSTRDLMTLYDLAALRDAGVRAIKIEGRMRRPEYVAATTAAYRAALDALQGGGAPDRAAERELMQMFNRGGFARGYGPGLVDAQLIEPSRPNHQGVAVGEAVSNGRIRLAADVEPGDALALRAARADDRPAGLLSGRAGEVVAARSAVAGDALIRLVSERQMRDARASYANEQAFARLNGRLTARPGEPATLRASDGVRTAQVSSPPVARATGAPADLARVQAQLVKTGGTPYAFSSIELDVDGRSFLPASLLNDLRRRALDELAALRRRDGRGCEATALPLADDMPAFGPARPDMPRLRAQASDPAALRLAIESGCDGAIFAPADLTEAGLARAEKELGDMRFSLALPAVAAGEALSSLHWWARVHTGRIESTLCANIGHLALDWPGILEADFGLNIANRPTLVSLWALGCRRYTPSVELTAGEIAAIERSGAGRELVIYGRLPMMYLRHCPIRAQLGGAHADCRYCDAAKWGAALNDHHLADRTGARFPLRRLASPGGCVVRVLNSVPLMALPQRSRLPAADGWRLIFEGEPAGEIAAIVGAHRAALDGFDPPAPPAGRYTMGHYFRGVS